ncbi:MAG: hypothetical protein ABIH23_12380 [bacterium]
MEHEKQTIIVNDDQVPAHLREESGPKVTVHHFEWDTSTSTGGIGGLVKVVLGFLVLAAVVFTALVGIWLLLFLGLALGIIAVVRSFLFPSSGRD